MEHKRAIISGLALLSAAACASGPPGPPGGGLPEGERPGGMLQEAKIARPIAILFTGFDTNRDLILDKSELEAAIPLEFQRADADRSGILTGFEMADWCRLVLGDKEALPDMRAMDTDLNYTVTLEEFTIALRHEFNRLDKNEDGRLTRAELLMDAPQRTMGRDGGQGQNGGRGRPSGGGGGGGRGGPGRGPG